MTKTITFSLKAEYFDAIVAGTKLEEYRLVTDYWIKRLANREYETIILTKGYPAADDTSRRIARPWRGCEIKVITHPHFGDDPVEVFAIPVNDPLPEHWSGVV